MVGCSGVLQRHVFGGKNCLCDSAPSDLTQQLIVVELYV